MKDKCDFIKCRRNAGWKCSECGYLFCDYHAEKVNRICPYHDEPYLEPIE